MKFFLRALSVCFDHDWPEQMVINDRYQILKNLGMGSYGISYLVYDLQTKQQLVLKRLRFQKRVVQKGMEGFAQEREMLKSLNSSAFPKYFENGIWQKSPYFTMEYIPGRTFEQLIFEDGNKYTEHEALVFGRELLYLIQTIHERGIIHRDLRIPNIMYDHGQLRIIDFGLARWINDPWKQRFDGTPKAVAPQSDFFQLGHFLLFLLYSSFEVDESKKEKPWQEELQIRKETKKLIQKLLMISPPFQSTEEILESLNRLIA